MQLGVGLGVGRGYGNRRSAAGGALILPSSRFALAEPGIWLDGEDRAVMWQDALGTVPVVNLGDPVGLVLDKRLWGGKTYEQVMAEQPELATNLASNSANVVYSGGVATFTNASTANSVNNTFISPGETYLVQYRIVSITSGSIRAYAGNNAAGVTRFSPGLYSEIITAVGNAVGAVIAVGTTTAVVDQISFRKIPGNHATQPTNPSRVRWQETNSGALGFKFDGVDDGLVTPAIDFSASDKVMMAAGVRKLSDATIAILAELSANLNTNNGSFYLAAPVSTSSTSYNFTSKGSAAAQAIYADASVAAPTSNVLVGLGDIGGDISRLRVDGGQVAENTVDQGSGNFGNYPLYIGRRGGTTLPFNGFLHQLVIRGGAWPDAVELVQLETFLAAKSKVSL